ncbi:MAG: ABC transporter substrate-binding protein [Candidatus Angelobacter sp. Gp1-AA117]|nr:MAG: ABC transporter substrate-binding protein [Candidatus Angelobacter sp. Gp1-AA117]
MIRYLLRRAGNIALMLLGVSILMFLLSAAAPGDVLSEARLNPQISPETLQAMRAQYGLDQPLPTRYWKWISSVVRGNLGYSFVYDVPASSLLWPRMLHTLLLTVPALFLSWIIALPLGVLAASRKGSWIDRAFSAGTSTLLAIPDLLLALLVLVFALRTHAFPVGGMNSHDAADSGWWATLVDTAWHMVLPVTVLVLGSMPTIIRHVRASMVEVLDSSYLKAAEGHGLSRFDLLYRYALPAAANPLITLLGLSVAALLSVSLLVEVVMSWPGMGPLLVEAILSHDLFVVIGATMLSILLMGVGNLFADLLLYAVDPRIRVQE